MRFADYISIALKDLLRQGVRSTLTLLALIISTVILVLMGAITVGGQQAIAQQFGSNDALTHIIVTPNQTSSSMSPFGSVQQVTANATKLDDTTVAKLQAITHVQTVIPRGHVWELSSFSIDGNSKQFVAQAEGIPGSDSLSLSAGSGFNAAEAAHVVVVGLGYAKALGYGMSPQTLIGKTIHFQTQKGYRGDGALIPPQGATQTQIATFNQTTMTLDAKIIGITGNGPDQNSIFLPLDWARAMRTAHYSQGGTIKEVDQLTADGYTTIAIKADSIAHVNEVTSAISQLGYGEVSILAQVEKLQQFSTVMWTTLGAVALVAVTSSALGVVNTMLMSVSEQRYTIGVWRACGARKRTIACLFLIESCILGLIGGTIGVFIGYAGSRFINNYVNSLLSAQGLNLANIAPIPIWLIAGTLILTTLFGGLAGLYPAYRAARQDPSKALASS